MIPGGRLLVLQDRQDRSEIRQQVFGGGLGAQIVGGEARGEGDGLDAGGVGGGDAAGGILHDDALRGTEAKTGRAGPVDLGVGLRVPDIRAGDERVEKRFRRADGGEVHQDLAAVGGRADGQAVAFFAQRVQNVQNAVRDDGFLPDQLVIAGIEVFLHFRPVRHAVFLGHAADVARLSAADKVGKIGFLCLDAKLFPSAYASS